MVHVRSTNSDKAAVRVLLQPRSESDKQASVHKLSTAHTDKKVCRHGSLTSFTQRLYVEISIYPC